MMLGPLSPKQGLHPALNLALTESLPSLVAFTRASAGRYWADTGLIAATSTNAARFDHTPGTAIKRGMKLESGVQNLLKYTENFAHSLWDQDGFAGCNVAVEANTADVLAPDGTQTATKVTDNSTNGQHIRGQYLGWTSGTVYTYSFYAKEGAIKCVRFRQADQNLTVHYHLDSGTAVVKAGSITTTMTSIRDGWYRCTATFTASITSTKAASLILVNASDANSYAGNGDSIYLWGAQCEASGGATSYIPASGSYATRAKDVATIPLGSWFNSKEGTLVCSAEIPFTRYTTVLCLDDGTRDNYLEITEAADGQIRFEGVNGGTWMLDARTNSYRTNSVMRIAIKWKDNDFSISVNGAAATTDTSGSVPAGLTTLRLSGDSSGYNPLNGWLSQLAYIPYAVSNSTLAILSANGGL